MMELVEKLSLRVPWKAWLSPAVLLLEQENTDTWSAEMDSL